MDSVNKPSENAILNAMGQDLNLKLDDFPLSLSTTDTKIKVLEFSEYLNSVGRLSLLHCDKSESEEFISLLLNLKRNIKYALGEIGRSCNKKKYEFECSECNEVINIDPDENFWTNLQNHEHIEYSFAKCLDGTIDNLPGRMASLSIEQETYFDPFAGTSNCEFTNENIDSGIDNDGDHNEVCDFTENHKNNEEGVNSFRFNFKLTYDDVIKNKIYPESIMNSVRKIDQIREYTIQKSCSSRAVCLLCSCELVVKTKISKSVIDYHAIGQRHIKFANTPENVNNVQKYHELFLKLEVHQQAHQVYFKPVFSTLRCVLCSLNVKHEDVPGHIQTNPHKKKVLDLFNNKSNAYYLVELQAHGYGVTQPQNEKEKEVKKEKIAVKAKLRPTEKNDSDSSPSSDSKEIKHNIIKSVKSNGGNNIFDSIPNRFREHLKYLKESDLNILCKLCKVTILKTVDEIKKHIRTASHQKASDVVLKRYNYYCEICNLKIADETAWNSHFMDGPNRHANMAESRKNKTTEYECTKCCTVIYGDDLSLTRHLSVNTKKDKKAKEPKLPEPVNKMFKSKESIESTAVTLTFEANDTLRYDEMTKKCCNRLETTLSTIFEGCKAYPFGSRISGLGDQHSDLDVFIDTGDMYTGYKCQDPQSQVQLVRKSAGVLCKLKEEFQDVFQIPTARTPIVKVYHTITDIECDLSFRHGLSVENTKFLRFCLDLQPITQSFILVLKKWSQHNNFSEHISTYALALMAIFYLQTKDYLLSVKKLRELNPKKSLVINGWETLNYTMPLETTKTFIKPYPGTVWNLLKEFFAYYTKFKYSEDVVCPLLGVTVLKKRFYEGVLPEEMNSYIVQLKGREPEHFRALSPVCVQDPFDLSHNLLKACQHGTLSKFKTMCSLSLKRLESLG